MTRERLFDLIAEGETFDVEFKGEESRPLSDDQLVEAVVCLANRRSPHSGWLLIGVEDDGRITGARPRHESGHIDLYRIRALIANRTQPALACGVELISVDDREILVIEVPPVRIPVGTSDGKYLRRAIGGRGKPECVPFRFSEMQALQADRGILDYSSLIVPEATWEDLDPVEFDRFRRSIEESRTHGDDVLLELSNVDLAKALGAVDSNLDATAIRVLGLLLFGKEEALRRFIPTHEVAYQVLVGIDVAMNDFFRWPLLRTMDEVLSRFRARNRETELIVGLLRVGVPDYSERAFREAVANAVIHRDYTRLGAVHIQWYEDRIEISNPGGFPEGVHLGNLLVTPPRPRNPLLADAFKRAGIVERTGRGIDTIFYEQLRNGRPAPSYEGSDETHVRVILSGGEANLDFVRLVGEEDRAGHSLSLQHLLLLNYLWMNRRITTARASALIQKPESEARALLETLVEAGLVEGRGERKGRVWHLSAETYRRLGLEAAYVRQRGYEPIQQEQMVLQYADKNGRITRREAAELCRIGPQQATRLLRRLVAEGKLRRHGETKGTWYDRGP